MCVCVCVRACVRACVRVRVRVRVRVCVSVPFKVLGCSGIICWLTSFISIPDTISILHLSDATTVTKFRRPGYMSVKGDLQMKHILGQLLEGGMHC